MPIDLSQLNHHRPGATVPHDMQPHLPGRGFIHTEVVILFGCLFGAIAGYYFSYVIATQRFALKRAVRGSFALALAAIGACLGYYEDFSILASSCLGYLIGLAIGSSVTTLLDQFQELGENEVPLRMFLLLWLPALLGGLIGGLYNEIMHGSPLFVALLKILGTCSACSVVTFALLFIVQAVDRRIARRPPLGAAD